MPRISQPLTQVRLTNVVIVRLYKGGKRWELACYPNKVKDWRDGKESDLSEVLQSERIFSNVHKGKFANETELKEVFGDEAVKNRSAVVKEILQKGSEQVNEYERKVVAADLMREACTLAADKLMNVSNGMRLTPTIVENALQEHKFTPKRGLTAKAIVPRILKILVAYYPDKIHPTLMRVLCKCDDIETFQRINDYLVNELDAIIVQESPETRTLIFRIQAKNLNKIEQCELRSKIELKVMEISDDTPLPEDRIKRLAEKKKDISCKQPSNDSSNDNDHSSNNSSSCSESEDDKKPFDSSNEPNVLLERSKEKFSFLMAGQELCSSESSPEDESEKEENSNSRIIKEALNEYLEKEHVEKPRLKKKSPRSTKEKKGLHLSSSTTDAIRNGETMAVPEGSATHTQTPSNGPSEGITVESAPSNDEATRSLTWCDICGVDYAEKFGSTLKQHIKQDCHIFNHKRNVKNLSPISHEMYMELVQEVQDPSILSSFRAVDS